MHATAIGYTYLNWGRKVWFGEQCDVQNGIVVDGVGGDLCRSSRMEAFCANSNICFALHPTKSAVVVSEWKEKCLRIRLDYIIMASSFLLFFLLRL